jgi:hypothetical protein
VYAAGAPAPRAVAPPGKRGPKTATSDAEVVAGIRAVLAASAFHGEGYRKVRARLAHRGLAVSGKRVLRLLRAHQLLAPRRLGPPNGHPAHDGLIITSRPDEMWGTDTTRFSTEEDGWGWFFGAIDHHLAELVAARRCDPGGPAPPAQRRPRRASEQIAHVPSAPHRDDSAS